MTIPTLIRSELARLVATPLARLALVALMLVPVLYGGLYLWANRDPYAGFDSVPAAIVVADSGDAAQKVADQVIDDGTFAWHRVSAATAAAGVADGRYDFSVTLPAGFSADLDSVQGTDPRQAHIDLVTNDTNSYLSSTIAQQATEAIRSSIAEQVGSTAAEKFLVGISDIRDKLSTAADGAGQLAEGVATAQSGAQSLADGTTQLASGAQQVADGTAQLAAKGDQAVAIGNQLAAQIPELRTQLQAQLVAAGLDDDQIAAVLAKVDPLAQQAGSAQAQLDALSAQVDALAAGAGQVSTGAQQAAEGASSLSSGLGTLAGGADQLRTGLRNGVDQIPSTTADQRDAIATTIGDPVSVERTADAKASNYGAGLAPFFVSLATWIGIYALFLIVKPISRRALSAVRQPVRVALAGWLTPALLGVIQMVAVFLVLTVGLHFGIADASGTLAFMMLVSATFAAILLTLNVLLGSVGQFLGLVLMVVQLVTAGGTFPWQTLPAPLAALHEVLPMSYAVDGLRQLMYGGSVSTALGDAGILALWLLGGLAVTALAAARMTHHRTLRDLRPSLIG